MQKAIVGIIAGIVFAPAAFAQSADDCINLYNGLKTQFEQAAAANGLAQMPSPYCVQEGNLISLNAEGPMPPISCEGGKEDHWHLEAKAIIGKDSVCVLMLRGLAAEENLNGNCGSEEARIGLAANQAAKWRRFLRDECAAGR